MDLNSIWSVLEESFDILGDYGYPAMEKVADAFALEPGYFPWVTAVWLFGSETITTTKYMQMFPYGLAQVNEERFASAAQNGYLNSDGKGGYGHTENGLKFAKKLWRAAGDSLADLNSIPFDNLQLLFDYLVQLIEASLAAPEPPYHFYISHKCDNYGQYKTEYPLEGFVVRFGELSAYRDDSHIAAWQALGVEGHAWDLFTRLWQSASRASSEQLIEKVAYRGIPFEMVVQDLINLSERGWIESAESAYQLTAEGRCIREAAEALTDQYFFTPWNCLNKSELEDLSYLAIQLHDGLENLNT